MTEPSEVASISHYKKPIGQISYSKIDYNIHFIDYIKSNFAEDY